LATGLIGQVFHDVFVATTSFAYAHVFPAIGLGASQTIVKWAIASLLILPQSILLGMTFPLMSAGVIRRVPQHAGRALAMLYFANSVGAAGGVLVAGFWLVALAGLPGTLVAAAIINIVVAAAVFIALRAQNAAEPELPTVTSATSTVSGLSRPRLWRLLLTVSFRTALASFIYEISWIRMLALVLGSATHSFELMLSAFILDSRSARSGAPPGRCRRRPFVCWASSNWRWDRWRSRRSRCISRHSIGWWPSSRHSRKPPRATPRSASHATRCAWR
jgi:MFS family permease